MSRKKAAAMIPQDSINLEQPPHVLPVLIGLVRGEVHPDSFEQERIFGHLTECVLCQDALRTLLAIELDRDRQIGITEEPIRKLISRLSRIIEKTQIRQDIPAYIEAVELWGDEVAQKRFPKFAEHLRDCKSCQLLVADVQNLKRQAEENGMIAPLAGGADG